MEEKGKFLSYLFNKSIRKVFVEQPWLHRVCEIARWEFRAKMLTKFDWLRDVTPVMRLLMLSILPKSRRKKKK